MLHILAQELNETLKGTAAQALFSDLGKRMYFPNGIIAQSGEAKTGAHVANGTIGMTVVQGTPAVLPSVHKYVPLLTPRELVAYAPTAGIPELREERCAAEKKSAIAAEKNITARCGAGTYRRAFVYYGFICRKR